MTKLTLFFAATVLTAPYAFADETLHPEYSPWTMSNIARDSTSRHNDVDYVAVIAKAIPEAFAPDVRVRLIEDGFGRANVVVGLREAAGEYRIFAARSLWLWPYTPVGIEQRRDGIKDGWPAELKDMKIDRCEIALGKPLAQRVIDVWKRMLLRVSYAEEPSYGMDGSEDHFAMNLNGRWIAGWVWTPERYTNTGRLEQIAYLMSQYCLTKDLNQKLLLEREVDELLQRLPPTEPVP